MAEPFVQTTLEALRRGQTIEPGEPTTSLPAKVARPPMMAGAEVLPIVPTSFEDVQRFAMIVAEAQLAPKSYGHDAAKIAIGIMTGLEVGFTPLMALQSIAVINGQPAIWGDGMVSLCMGRLDLYQEVEGTDLKEGAFAAVTVQRGKIKITRTFSMADAKAAGLVSKDVWKSYPKRMLLMRARSWALRDSCADILKGLKAAEEVMDYDVDLTRDHKGDFVPSAPVANTEPPEPIAETYGGGRYIGEAGMPKPHFASEEEKAAAMEDAEPTQSEALDDMPSIGLKLFEQDGNVLDELQVDLTFAGSDKEIDEVWDQHIEKIKALSPRDQQKAVEMIDDRRMAVAKEQPE